MYYKISFNDDAQAGFPANSVQEAHNIAREYAEGSRYKMYVKIKSSEGYAWEYLGDSQ